MNKHVTVVGVIRIGWGIIGILGAIVVLAATVGTGLVFNNLQRDPQLLAILTAVGVPLTVLILALAVPNVIAGIGVLKLRPWARYLAMVMAVLDLINIPIGTAIGIYTIVVLMLDKTAALFESRAG